MWCVPWDTCYHEQYSSHEGRGYLAIVNISSVVVVVVVVVVVIGAGAALATALACRPPLVGPAVALTLVARPAARPLEDIVRDVVVACSEGRSSRQQPRLRARLRASPRPWRLRAAPADRAAAAAAVIAGLASILGGGANDLDLVDPRLGYIRLQPGVDTVAAWCTHDFAARVHAVPTPGSSERCSRGACGSACSPPAAAL